MHPIRLSHTVHAGRGPLLLLVHGFLTAPSQWRSNLDALAPHCTPVTVSLWGHAGAPSPERPEAYDPDAYVTAFEALRDELGAERWFVLGYSLGAGLTLRYAFTHPERLYGHLFTNSTSALADVDQQNRWLKDAAAAAARIRAGGRAAMERIPVHPRHANRLPAAIYQALCADAERHDPAGIANTLLHTNPQATVRHRLGENRRPARLICGLRERRFQPHREFAERTMPELDVVDLDAGHGLNMEAPDAFNTAVVTFLEQWTTS